MLKLAIDPPVILTLKTAGGQRVQVAVVPRPLAMAADHWRALTAAEQQRAEQLKNRRRQIEYVAGHALLNRLLGQAGADWQLWIEPGGRPCARVGGAPMAVSLSHSGGWICAASGPVAALGVDIEASTRPRDFRRLAARLAWPEDLDRAQFLRRWALWEATGKSRGASALRAHDVLFDRLAALAGRDAVSAVIHSEDHGALLAPLAGQGWLSVVGADVRFTEIETSALAGLWNPT